MNSKLLKLASIASAIAIPIGAVVSCGPAANDNSYVKYNGGKINKANVWFVTDGGSITDKSFNQSGYEGFDEATGFTGEKNVKKPKKAAQISEAYDDVKANHGKLIVAMGFNHNTALNQFTPEHPEMGFIFIDEKLPMKDKDGKTKQQGNVVSVVYKTEQAAFLEGVVAAKKANEIDSAKPQIGFWGGMDIPSVTSFTHGLKQGVEFFNAHLPKDMKAVELIDGGYPGNFKPGGGRNIAVSLLNKGADLLLGVAGPQTADGIAAIKAKEGSKAQVIGVDTDYAKKVPGDAKYIFDSITKELKKSTKQAIESLLTDTTKGIYALGKVVEEDLKSKGVSIVHMNLLDTVKLTGETKDQIIEAAKKAKA